MQSKMTCSNAGLTTLNRFQKTSVTKNTNWERVTVIARVLTALLLVLKLSNQKNWLILQQLEVLWKIKWIKMLLREILTLSLFFRTRKVTTLIIDNLRTSPKSSFRKRKWRPLFKVNNLITDKYNLIVLLVYKNM